MKSLFLALSLFSGIVLADPGIEFSNDRDNETETNRKVEKEDKEDVKESTKKQKSNSAANRVGKGMLFTGQVIGLGPAPVVLATGLSLGWFLDSDSILSIEGTKNSTTSSGWFSDDNYSSTSIGVHYKAFVSSSFYVKGGVDYVRLNHEHESYSFLFVNNNGYGYQSESLGVSLLIGNQWQFSAFTIGCDWVGYYLPLSTTFRDEYTVTSGGTDMAKAMKEDQDKIKQGNGQAVRFYLGWAW